MTEINLSPQAQSIVARVKAILFKPKEEWAVIEAEPATLPGLYTGYVCILAAIPAIAIALGLVLIGWNGYHFSIGGALQSGISSYIASLLGVAVLGFAIEFIGPQFGAEQKRIPAFKLAVYSMTPAWVAGVLCLIPSIGSLAGLVGLYGVYILWLGLPKLIPAPAEKAQTFAIVVVVIALVVLGMFIGTGQMSSRYGGFYADNAPARGTMNVPGYGSVDLGRAEAAGKATDAAITSALAEGSTRATVQPVAAEALSQMLPGTVAGFLRGEVTSASAGAGGMNTASARASYRRGDGEIQLSVTDLGGAAAFAQLGSAFNVNHSEQTGGKYERVGNVGGRLTTEKYDAADRSGEYSVVVAERFMIEAEGRGVAMADLKAAVAAVGFNRLEAMAHAA